MSKSVSADKETVLVDAMCWRMLYKIMNRYEGNTAAELLTLATISLLDKADYGPTITELVELTGVPKTRVSRYVSRAVQRGILAEVVDLEDRRLRHLRLTAKGRSKGACPLRRVSFCVARVRLWP